MQVNPWGAPRGTTSISPGPSACALACHLEVEASLEDDERLLPRGVPMEIDARARRLDRLEHAVRAFDLALARLKASVIGPSW